MINPCNSRKLKTIVINWTSNHLFSIFDVGDRRRSTKSLLGDQKKKSSVNIDKEESKKEMTFYSRLTMEKEGGPLND